ncbi:prevent-host-death protein [Nonomuraea sp. NPDC050556]|uniref:prevent-host-death protein n=1 Tax=Nonomuraea sp. NPDC050556 TaxID=3364369 RepID=UPI00379020BD
MTVPHEAHPDQPEITQRDLDGRSVEIVDAVERGGCFHVAHDGHRIGELVPQRRTRRFVPREDFLAMPRTASLVDPEDFRASAQAFIDDEVADPYGR